MCFGIFNAQQTVNVSGGDATGTNGKISYTIGQVAYSSTVGSNGSVSQGVQQPFEFATLGIDNFPTINLEMSLYPNPSTTEVHLKIKDYSSKQMEYSVFDMTGKLKQSKKITAS